MNPIFIAPRSMLDKKPAHGQPCNRCGLCCVASLCDLAQYVFHRMPYPGPCPALIRSLDGYSCGMVVQPGRFNAEASVQYGEDRMRDAALLLINGLSGCDARFNGEPQDLAYDRKCDDFDRANAEIISKARAMWGMP